MKKLEQLYEGKAKKVFATDDPELFIVDYKDDATAFNGEKRGTIVGKGVINNKVTNFLMQKLEKEGVPTHFVKQLSDREIEVLSQVAQGKINKEIADILNIGLTTVITHRKNIQEKLGLKSVSALTIYAVMHGYVDINKI